MRDVCPRTPDRMRLPRRPGLMTPIAAFGLCLTAATAWASSHREAPQIAEDPAADATDLYAFLSPDGPAPGNGARVTLIACYLPFQEPAGGGTPYRFSDDVLYALRIDNTGDAAEDIIYQFRFHTETTAAQTSLYALGTVLRPDADNLNVRQTYTVTRIDVAPDGSRRTREIARDLPAAPAYLGPLSNADRVTYEATAAAAVAEIEIEPERHTLFAGPRDDGAYMDLHAVVDGLNLSRADAPPDQEGARDSMAGFNVLALALQVPVTAITADGSEPMISAEVPDGGANAIVGVWTTASRRKHTALSRGPGPRHFGPWVQVSRLGLPLMNTLVVPHRFKDAYNRSRPWDDETHLAEYLLDPELAFLLNALQGVDVPPPPRLDLISFISFLPGTLTQRENLKPADMLRLNLALPQTAPNQINRLGVIAGDSGGFPNGRRIGDDVLDVFERVVGGGVLAPGQPQGGGAVSYFELFPNNALGDGVDENDVPTLGTFPYLGTPHAGFAHTHAAH